MFMVNTNYVTENDLTAQVEQSKTEIAKGTRKIFKRFFKSFFLTLVIWSICFAFLWFGRPDHETHGNVILIMIATITVFVFYMLFSVFRFMSSNAAKFADYGRLQAGAEGEDIALDILNDLPDDFTLFNQIEIPNKKSRTGVNEADMIVAGPHCIFVVEVKHNHGHIQADVGDKSWGVTKTGQNGGQYAANPMRNPVLQVKNLVWILSQEFKKKKVNPWVQGVVLFTNDRAHLSLSGESAVSVFKRHDILNYMQNFKPESHSSANALKKAEKHLQHLAQAEKVCKP